MHTEDGVLSTIRIFDEIANVFVAVDGVVLVRPLSASDQSEPGPGYLLNILYNIII